MDTYKYIVTLCEGILNETALFLLCMTEIWHEGDHIWRPFVPNVDMKCINPDTSINIEFILEGTLNLIMQSILVAYISELSPEESEDVRFKEVYS